MSAPVKDHRRGELSASVILHRRLITVALNHVRLAAQYAVLRRSPLCVPGVLLYRPDEKIRMPVL